MNEQKPAFEFQPEIPVQFTLNFDTPKTGTGQYGEWYLYGATINGQMEKFFAPPSLHQKIQFVGMHKGSTGIIMVRAKISDNGKPYKDYMLKFNNQIIELPKNSTAQAFVGKVAENNLVKAEVKQTRDFEAEAFGKCKHAFLLALMAQGAELSVAEPLAEKWAQASMRILPKTPAQELGVDGPAGHIEDNHPDDEIRVENIPF